MNCSGYERQMSDYLDGQLSRASEDALRFHLNGCPRCRLKIEDMESAIRAVKSLSPATPQPEFDHRLSSLLTKEMARELYGTSWWRRASGAFAELGELSRQRPVQLVFATSLILTVTLIGGFAGFVGPPERPDSSPTPPLAVSVPTPIEPVLAPPDPISPFPLERELAPHMAIDPAMNTEQTSNPPSPAPASFSFNPSRIPDDSPGIMTVRTMEPTAHGFRLVSAGAGMRLDPSLFTESLSRDLDMNDGTNQSVADDRLQPVSSAEMNDNRRVVVPPGQSGQTGPPAPLRRIRISF